MSNLQKCQQQVSKNVGLTEDLLTEAVLIEAVLTKAVLTAFVLAEAVLANSLLTETLCFKSCAAKSCARGNYADKDTIGRALTAVLGDAKLRVMLTDDLLAEAVKT